MSLGGETGTAGPESGAGNSTPIPTTHGEDSAQSQAVQDVLTSEIGINVMLSRLKQSIASAKEFSQFLKKRSVLEDEHANSLKKLCRLSLENMNRGEQRGGTFAKAYEDMMSIHERMADNGLQFSMSLHQMSDDLQELAAVAEKSRKGWKQNGLAAEQRVADLENAMRKSKSKYDALAEEYDRARTGDTAGRQGGKMFGFKGHKSGPQHEEDLLRKAQAADQDYQGKVQAASTERSELLAKTRPETVKALQDVVKECDSGLVLQMQKFASFNEKLVLSNGLSISPLKNGTETRSLRECILAIENEKDLNDYVASQHSRMPPKTTPPKYERNPLIDPSHRASTTTFSQQPSVATSAQPPLPQPGMFQNSRSNTFSETPNPNQGGTLGHSYNQSMSSVPVLTNPQRPSSQPQQHERSFSHGSNVGQGPPGPGIVGQYGGRGSTPQQQQQQQQQQPQRFNGSYTTSGSQGPPQLGALPFQSSQSQQSSQQPPYSQLSSQGGPAANPLQQHPAIAPPQSHRHSPPVAGQMAPARPVFGVALSKLYERDSLAVPMVVYQCIQAVDLFGLNVEGIYRLSGSVPHVNKLKTLFDTDSTSSNLDFRNPENFFHDVNSVAGLLKQFFRDLPDPLLTREHYSAFVDAAKNEDDIVRRDSLHAIINSLPDPNYATLRALTLHLHRVIDNSGANRMSSQNLAIVFGPTLMGTIPGSSIADAGWQVRVVDTILQNTYQIFDEDD
ncbi:hypothetical protein QBC44DRAFT_317152 [Cladorrhinum sp. PSN332]|nr:hypothetical protein QBC44DRAFT_317152 [Cladorrhinum sp. PSN332]